MSQAPFSKSLEQPECLSQMQKEALARMKNVVERRGLGVLSGEVGSGKSTLFRMLAASLPNTQYHVIYLCSAGLAPKELYAGILRALGEEPGFSLGKIKQQWRTLLETQLTESGRQLVVMIDEAHELPANTLLELRFLLKL